MEFATDNPNRTRVRNAVELAPGIHLRELQRLMGLSFTTVRHHVAKLARAGDVECSAQGGYTRIFPRGFPESERGIVSALRRGSSRQVLRELLRGKGTSNKEISLSTGLAKSTVAKHLKLLKGLGIVREDTSLEGRGEYTLQNPGLIARLVTAGGAKLDLASDRYIELWGF